jgi:membrane-bound lytic murein transglycosylase D
MTRRERRSCIRALIAGLLLAFASCSPRQVRLWSAPVVDPRPPVPAVYFTAEPPQIAPAPNAAPASVKHALERATHTEAVSAAIREAERRFELGKQLLRRGEPEKARAEFDAAIQVLLGTPLEAWDRHRAEDRCEQLIEEVYALERGTRKPEPEEAAFQDSPLDDVLSAAVAVDPGPVISENWKLPSSGLPLEVNGAVMKFIRFFSSGKGRRILENGLRRQGRYREMIRRILNEEGLPPELIYLAQAESGFLPRAVSRKQAAGIWQFVRFRGRQYGLAQTKDYDDRLDPEKATRAAARHLKDLYEAYGDWYLAMVAYNAGPGAVIRARRRTKTDDFWEFCRRRAIPRETQNYVPIILAMTIMAKNPHEFGLEDVVPDPPLEYNTIHVREATHLGLIADLLGRPLAEIRELNPAILRDVAPAGYNVHVPKGTGGFVMAALETVPPGRRASWRVHRLGQGQTLAEIARLYRTTEESIRLANGGHLDELEEGDLMLIPVGYPVQKASGEEQPVRRRVRRRAPASPTAGVRLPQPRAAALAP